MYTWRPFFRYSPAISASLPNSFTRCHSVRSCFSPEALSVQASDVAMRRLVMAVPLPVYRVSGSAPRLPTIMTLLIPRAMDFPLGCVFPPIIASLRDARADGVGPGSLGDGRPHRKPFGVGTIPHEPGRQSHSHVICTSAVAGAFPGPS